MIAIALPIAALTAAAAFSTYRTLLDAISVSQMRTAEDFAVRSRVWYRGALRSLLLAAGVYEQASPADRAAGCPSLGPILRGVSGYSAVYLHIEGQPACFATIDEVATRAEVEGLTKTLLPMPVISPWAGKDIAESRYGEVEIRGRSHLAVLSKRDVGGRRETGILLVDPQILANVFDLGGADPTLAVALVSRGKDAAILRSGGPDGGGWLPREEHVPATIERWSAPSRDGDQRTYVARMVAEPDFYVVASFDRTAERAAVVQFYALLLVPLLMLMLLCLVYVRAIDQHCVRWLRGIEAAARSRVQGPRTQAPISDTMPNDIRSVAEAFNTMVDEQGVRQRRLQTALDDNRFLVRELHHRVKNSLQVVQSYLGLTKRQHRGEARAVLADAECRVHVLSAAYRFTLADGEMQPVRVDLFLDDVVAMIGSLIRTGAQDVSATLDSQASLPIDRIIPLGFMIVDVVSSRLRGGGDAAIAISISDVDAATIEVAIRADRDSDPVVLPRLFAGLLTQVEAVAIPYEADRRTLGVWHIRHNAPEAPARVQRAAGPGGEAGVMVTPTLKPTNEPVGPT
ncbi:sensor histidine kinase [Bosea sp. TWI1241]|uniref:sensor histidine kinase n=1 Tax=Bosea sp. TWI1241 TaxID=3148904 RepID=UPI0032090F42